VPESQTNFWWTPCTDPGAAQEVTIGLEHNGIVARGTPAGVRVTVDLPHENDQFIAALDRVLQIKL
jgi:histidinol-phosphate/aromatic aminotransferase/cobyric acid decarboxylase-like protein